MPWVIAALTSAALGGVAGADGVVAALGAVLAPVAAALGLASAASASPAGRPCLVPLALGVPDALAPGEAVDPADWAALGVPVAEGSWWAPAA